RCEDTAPGMLIEATCRRRGFRTTLFRVSAEQAVPAPRPAHTPRAKEAPMAEMVSDYILERLREWGVTRVFGYPGDGINGFLGAFDRAESEGGPEFIQARHEEMAAFMACGHAKFTGEIGVCIATSGPGAIHLLNGLYDAKLDH